MFYNTKAEGMETRMLLVCNPTMKSFMAPRDKTGDIWQVVVVSSSGSISR